jgi:hypothetical protein
MDRVRLPLKRRKKPSLFVRTIMGRFAVGAMALKNEYTSGIICLLLLNLLLLMVNIIDINHLWFNFEYSENELLKKVVHDGTELLIVSIVLAMAVLLFFFKGNLNFYRGNKWLRYGAYAWIVQNLVLVISVALRDYYYIARHGLAYKRIGVLFFLFMVLIGLLTVFLKIANKKTGYYLWRVNAWAGIIILVLSTTVQWDEFIARYNLDRKDKTLLDVPFLLSLSDKALPILDQNVPVFIKIHKERPMIIDGIDYLDYYLRRLEQRKKEWFQSQSTVSWLSWNYADAEVKKYFDQAAGLSSKLNP